MIIGDSLQVMASLAEREALRGKVQCIYIDPPYGIKFNSNFQWSTTSRDVKDGNVAHITREPEQVRAFRDTWRDGVHSYLTYLRDRLTVARDLLTESGSIFVQIGDENVHRLRALLDEIFHPDNFVTQITFMKNSGATDALLASPSDMVHAGTVRQRSAKLFGGSSHTKLCRRARFGGSGTISTVGRRGLLEGTHGGTKWSEKEWAKDRTRSTRNNLLFLKVTGRITVRSHSA